MPGGESVCVRRERIRAILIQENRLAPRVTSQAEDILPAAPAEDDPGRDRS